MSMREEVLRDTVNVKVPDREWVAGQMVKLYRSYILEGMSDKEAVQRAKEEMEKITGEAIAIRRQRGRSSNIEAWFVIILGALACYGWWILWS